MVEFRMLLDRFWITQGRDRDLFYQVRRQLPALRRALRELLGWEVISNEKVIRLVKQPAQARAAFGIQSFTTIDDYCLLCGLLLFLEDRDDGERFLLSELVQSLSAYVKPFLPQLTWEKFRCRTALVRVLRYAEGIDLLKACDGEREGFSTHQDQEVLYENTGLSRWFSIHFRHDISRYSSFTDFEQPPETGSEQERGVFRTYRVYRQLVLAPAVYWQDPADAVYAYIKNQRSAVQRNLDQLLDGKLQIYHNGAFFLPAEGADCSPCFPQDQMISDILLLLFEQLEEKILCGAFVRDPDDRVHLPIQSLQAELELCRQAHAVQWGKTFAEKDIATLVQDVINALCFWDFATVEGDTVTLNPAAALWQGLYSNRGEAGRCVNGGR